MPPLEGPRWLDDRLWGDAHAARSRELTPLYVSRYRGPRTSSDTLPHAFWELTAAMGGHGCLHAPDAIPLEAGTVILVPPGLPHREDAPDARFDTIYIALRGERLPEPAGALTVHSPPLIAQAEELWLFAERGNGLIGPELDGLARRFLAHFLRRLDEGRRQPGLDSIDQAIRYFHEHFAEPVSISEVAAACGCSTGHFQRLFRHRTGRGPLAYLTGVRIHQAMHLLTHTSLPVNRVAELAGFTDPFYFSRRFRQLTGHSPRAHRARAR